jgi:hypothetical protein
MIEAMVGKALLLLQMAYECPDFMLADVSRLAI